MVQFGFLLSRLRIVHSDRCIHTISPIFKTWKIDGCGVGRWLISHVSQFESFLESELTLLKDGVLGRVSTRCAWFG